MNFNGKNRPNEKVGKIFLKKEGTINVEEEYVKMYLAPCSPSGLVM